MSKHVFYASECGAKLDSNVLTGGGTDDTEVIQGILDKATELGGLHLVMDGAALIRGLEIHSNTTIECLNKSCGFFLAPGANRSMLRNANANFKVRKDRNITLIGGTYNQNCREQVHHLEVPEDCVDVFTGNNVFGNRRWVIGMEFFGVENLIVRNVTIRNQRTFGMLVVNWYNVNMEDIRLELPDHMYAQNQDGIHFWGPGQFLKMRNISGSSGDDFIALAPDEHDLESDITDVIIDGVFLENADQGIRLLSRGKGRLDRVLIKNVVGTYKSFGFIINPWFAGNGGNYGNIVFDTIDLRQTEPIYDYTDPFLFRVGGNVERLTLRNVFHHNPTDNRSILEVGGPYITESIHAESNEPSFVGALVIDGLHIMENDNMPEDTAYIKLKCPVENVIVKNVQVIRKKDSSPTGCLIKTMSGCDVDFMILEDVYANRMNCLVDAEEGEVKTLHIKDIVSEDMGEAELVNKGKAEISKVFIK